MTSSRLFLALWLVAGCLLGGCREREAPQAPRPSILLLTVDALRADHLAAYGYADQTAPFISSLANKSTLFVNARSTSSWTVPALTSLVTGVYPPSHGVVHGQVQQEKILRQEVIPGGLPLLGEVLQQAGYKTYAVVSNLHARRKFGYARGFDRYRVLKWSSAEAVNQTVLKWQKEIEASREPVFLWLHYFDPHMPYRPREPWFERYRKKRLGGLPGKGAGEWNLEAMQALRKAGGREDPSVLRGQLGQAVAAYDSEISYCDEHIRKLFEAMPGLQEWHLLFSADHGEEFLEHGRVSHGFNLHRETLRVPLFFRRPGQDRSIVRHEVASWIDLAPSIVALAGGRAPENWQGVSLVGDSRIGKDRRVLAWLNRGEQDELALVGGDWKMMIDRRRKTTRLYDLHNDPVERRDQAGARPEIVEKLEQELVRALERVPGPPASVATEQVTPEMREQLRSLGYVE